LICTAILKHMLKQEHALDRTFHALSDATRRALLDRLARGPASVSELARPFGSSLAAIVQHVQVLEASGLITTEKVGRTRTCCISRESVLRAEQWLTERRQLWEARFDRLGAILEAQEAHVPKAKSLKRKRSSKS
jgi:DNA-binding transcriptional ArsR family regulator